MTPHRIWIVSELYYPEETSTGYVLTKIAEGLAEQYAVNVLCGQPSYSARGVRAPRVQAHNGVHIRRCSATTLNKNVLPFRLLNLVTISLSLFFHALWRFQKHDFVLAVTNPPSLPFLMALACRLRGARFLLLVHDVYPEILIVTGMLRADSLTSRLGARLNQWLYRSAARIIVLGRDMQALARQRLEPEARQRVVVIPNWADVTEITPQPRARNELLQELGLARKFVAQYAGNMGPPNDLESILECARRLGDDATVQFLFIGGGAKFALVKKQTQANKLNNVTLLPGRPRREQQIFLNACDVAIVSLIRGMAGVSVPSRMYNIMAAGKPILVVADAESESARLVQEEGIGWVVPPGQPEAIVEAINAARANPERLVEMGQRARCAAETKYSFKHVIGAYHSLMLNIND